MTKKPDPKEPAARAPAAAPADEKARIRAILIAAATGLVALVLVFWFVLAPRGGAARSEAELEALNRPHAATLGNPAASVTIVEFLDPACGTCREFYPLVKGVLNDNPGRIRLAIRMVAFHQGSDVAVKALEAAKRQDKFWLVLERLLASQPRWVVNHRVDPDALWSQLQSIGVDFERLKADMESPEVAKNLALDARDAKTLKVAATPEYFVNGRGLPEFGYDPLLRLVRDELARSAR